MIPSVTGRRVAQLAGLLRRRLHWTQAQVAAKAGVGRWKVIKLEAGELACLRFGDVESCLDALGARLVVSASYRGAEADRLLDEVHARLVAAIVGVLRKLGWETRVEVSFSEFGERGSIDVLAWYPAMRVLLVIEVKSELGSIEGTLRPLDVKVRLALKVARERFGWEARLVSRMIVLPENSAARRAVGRNAPALDAMLPARSRQLRACLRQPSGPIAGIWFLSAVGHFDTMRNPSSIRRVRRPSPRSDQAT
jgi:transcriptional regulator with XRE-family HTH domain